MRVMAAPCAVAVSVAGRSSVSSEKSWSSCPAAVAAGARVNGAARCPRSSAGGSSMSMISDVEIMPASRTGATDGACGATAAAMAAGLGSRSREKSICRLSSRGAATGSEGAGAAEDPSTAVAGAAVATALTGTNSMATSLSFAGTTSLAVGAVVVVAAPTGTAAPLMSDGCR